MSPVPDLSAIPEPFRGRWRQRRMLLFYILFHGAAAFFVLPWPWIGVTAGEVELQKHSGQSMAAGITLGLVALLASFVAGWELMDRRRRDALRVLLFAICAASIVALYLNCQGAENPFITGLVESDDFRTRLFNSNLPPDSPIHLRMELGLAIAVFAVLNASLASAYLWKLHPEHDPSQIKSSGVPKL